MEGHKRAFPFAIADVSKTQAFDVGMTLRDYFAAKAMQAMISQGTSISKGTCARASYLMAHEMMKAREL